MSCVVGVVANGDVFMGADSLSTSDSLIYRESIPKIIVRGELMLGIVGASALHDSAVRGLAALDCPSEFAYEFMVRGLVPKLRETFSNDGVIGPGGRDSNGFRLPEVPGYMLIGLAGRLFFMDVAMSISEPEDGYFAVGSGREVALGCMWMQRRAAPSVGPIDFLRNALNAAKENCVGVGGRLRFFNSSGEITGVI